MQEKPNCYKQKVSRTTFKGLQRGITITVLVLWPLFFCSSNISWISTVMQSMIRFLIVALKILRKKQCYMGATKKVNRNFYWVKKNLNFLSFLRFIFLFPVILMFLYHSFHRRYSFFLKINFRFLVFIDCWSMSYLFATFHVNRSWCLWSY